MESANARQAFIAATRFGYGLRPGELATIQADPKGWLLSQLETITRIPGLLQDAPGTTHFLVEEAAQRLERRNMGQQPDQQAIMEMQQQRRRRSVQQSREQMGSRLRVAVETDQPFVERLVRFWSNHFTVAATGGGRKAVVRNIAYPYENEAIRASLDTDFATLLLAVEQHPAMLIYLDNDQSIGEFSTAGQLRDRGLNENLAREILELHTLGVNGGYTQADVTSLARIITGWTVAIDPVSAPRGRRQPVVEGLHGFRFTEPMHEPGAHELLGKTYRNRGLGQGEDALQDLARHPATANHIARKLATHFVADTPPAAAVASLEKVFINSHGNLPALHRALVDLNEAWQPEHRKLKTPEDYIVSVARGTGLPGRQAPDQAWVQLAGTLGTFNQAPFTASSPAGWPDTADHWGSPDALLKRIEWANQMAGNIGERLDPVALQRELLPENPPLAQAISRAESRSQGLALLLASPEFQWR